jgi:hypothetical protein
VTLGWSESLAETGIGGAEMNIRSIQLLGMAAIAAASASPLMSSPAEAQVRYGEWRSYDCEPARSRQGLGSVKLPQAEGGARARDCMWERTVEECPRIRDRARHFIRCVVTRRQRSGPSQHPPRD